MGHYRHHMQWVMKPLDMLGGAVFYALLKSMKAFGVERGSNFAGKTIAPLLYKLLSHKTARENLTIAFPNISSLERENIIQGMLDNLCRTVFEYANMDELWDYDEANPNLGRIETDAIPVFEQLRNDGKPALIFSAHLGNFELPAVAAAAHGLDATALYRIPNNPYIAKVLGRIRGKTMGKMVASGRSGVVELARALQAGSHVGMLIDQRLTKGVKVQFFGREVTANPTIARLARQIDCPIHGVRVIRKSGCSFKIEMTEEIHLPRDFEGKIDIQASMQLLTTIIEGWVREHPEQWLWLHRRFR